MISDSGTIKGIMRYGTVRNASGVMLTSLVGLPEGARVKIVGRPAGGYLTVQYQGKEFYVHESDVEMTGI